MAGKKSKTVLKKQKRTTFKAIQLKVLHLKSMLKQKQIDFYDSSFLVIIFIFSLFKIENRCPTSPDIPFLPRIENSCGQCYQSNDNTY